ncbi:MAG: hypothetical protein JO322_05150 [Candidatus Eremiobacteraeota bacterium]|nr:hypothetical protein [Candidatus Eremiobacteraeota bacterium]
MRTSVFFTALALAAAAAGPVFAQAPPPRPTPNPQMRQQFDTMRRQMDQIHSQERAQMLGALAPAHRQLLATIAGELATSTTPDYSGAAARLDAALSPSEKQTILNASQSARDKMGSAMQSMRQQMSQNGGPPPGPGGPMMMGPPPGGTPDARRTPSAGELLLRTAMGGGRMAIRIRDSMQP